MLTPLILHISQIILSFPVTYKIAVVSIVYSFAQTSINSGMLYETEEKARKAHKHSFYSVLNVSVALLWAKEWPCFHVSHCTAELVSSDVSAKPVLLC